MEIWSSFNFILQGYLKDWTETCKINAMNINLGLQENDLNIMSRLKMIDYHFTFYILMYNPTSVFVVNIKFCLLRLPATFLGNTSFIRILVPIVMDNREETFD